MTEKIESGDRLFDNKPIQIYSNFYHPKNEKKKSDKNFDIFHISA